MKKIFFLLGTVILLNNSSLEAGDKEKCPLLPEKENKESSSSHNRKRKEASSTLVSSSLISQQEEKFAEGVRKFSQHKYDKAFNHFMEIAQLGHPKAQYNLGLCYELGVGVKASFKDAITWYSYSAANNNEKAIQKIIYFSQTPH